MNCPVCKTHALNYNTLEDTLVCMSCSDCGGHWVEAESYEKWLSKTPESSELESGENKSEPAVNLVSGERSGLKFCPQCKHVLLKYKIGHEINFHLDRCGHCGGVWFDKNEWQLLKANDLHDQVQHFFSQHWQNQLLQSEHAKAMRKILIDRLGQKDYEELERIRTWLDGHEKADELYALLLGSRQTPRTPRVRIPS